MGVDRLPRGPANVQCASLEIGTKPLGRLRAGVNMFALAMALATTALACNGGTYGITFVGEEPEGTLVARGNWAQFGPPELHTSDDGGHTWQLVGETGYGQDEGPLQVITPRGTYRIIPSGPAPYEQVSRLDARIVRTLNGRSDTVFSVEQLLDNANIGLQRRTRWGVETEFHSIHYDAGSGNIVAAMGTQGVLVETPDGRWARVPVGRFVPTDFSAGPRARLLVSSPFYWVSTLVLTVVFTAVAFVLAYARIWEFAIALAIAGVIAAAAYAFYRYSNLDPLGAVLTVTVIMAALVIVALSLLFMWEWDSHRRRVLALVILSVILAGAVFLFPGFPGTSVMDFFFQPPVLVIPAIPMVTLLAVTIFPYFPIGRVWRDIGVLVTSMIIVSALPVLLWLLYIISYDIAKLISVGLFGLLAIILAMRLRNLRENE